MTREAWMRHWRAVEWALRFDMQCLKVLPVNPINAKHMRCLEEMATEAAGGLAACEEGTYQPPASFVGPYASFEL